MKVICISQRFRSMYFKKDKSSEMSVIKIYSYDAYGCLLITSHLYLIYEYQLAYQDIKKQKKNRTPSFTPLILSEDE